MLKIAVSTLGEDPSSRISDLFEECTHLQIYDGDTEKLLEVIPRDGRSDVELAQILADLWVEAVICGPIKQDAFDIIASDEYSITRYNGTGMTAIEGLKAALSYKLDVIRDPIDGIGCLGHHLHIDE